MPVVRVAFWPFAPRLIKHPKQVMKSIVFVSFAFRMSQVTLHIPFASQMVYGMEWYYYLTAT